MGSVFLVVCAPSHRAGGAQRTSGCQSGAGAARGCAPPGGQSQHPLPAWEPRQISPEDLPGSLGQAERARGCPRKRRAAETPDAIDLGSPRGPPRRFRVRAISRRLKTNGTEDSMKDALPTAAGRPRPECPARPSCHPDAPPPPPPSLGAAELCRLRTRAVAAMADPQLQLVAQRIRSFPDFPSPGVLFRCARAGAGRPPGTGRPEGPAGRWSRWPGLLSRA